MFFFDCEAHIIRSQDDINYFPFMKQERAAYHGTGPVRRMTLFGIEKEPPEPEVIWGFKGDLDAECLIRAMDEAGIQMAAVLPEPMMPWSYGARVLSTNGWLVEEVAKYPNRLIAVCNVGPFKVRGMKNCIWELDYLVKNMNVKGVKIFPPDDIAIDDRELWPFYEKVAELEIPLSIHTGVAWTVPGSSEYCMPFRLEAVCEDFPTIPIIAFHMGYPRTEELNVCLMKYPNLYVGTSLFSRYGPGMSKNGQRILGQALRAAGPDRIVWGIDSMGRPPGVPATLHKNEVRLLKEFEISEEVQEYYGVPPLTDEIKAKWAGLNLAKLYKIKPPKA